MSPNFEQTQRNLQDFLPISQSLEDTLQGGIGQKWAVLLKSEHSHTGHTPYTLGWTYPAQWHLYTEYWGLLRPLQSYKSSGQTLMLLLPAWTCGQNLLFVHELRPFVEEKGDDHPASCPRLTVTLPNHYQSFLALSVHTNTVLWMWCTRASLHLLLLSSLTRTARLLNKATQQRSSGQSGSWTAAGWWLVEEDVAWRGTRSSLAPS